MTTTLNERYLTVKEVKELLQSKEQEFDSLLDCHLYRMSKEVTSMLAVYDSLTPDEITTRFRQLTMVTYGKKMIEMRQASEARWRNLWNKLKFWKIRTSKKSEEK